MWKMLPEKLIGRNLWKMLVISLNGLACMKGLMVRQIIISGLLKRVL